MEDFREIRFEDKTVVYDFYRESGLLGSDFSFVTLCGWQKCNELEISINKNFIVFKINLKKGVRFYSPLVKEKDSYLEAIKALEDYMQNNPIKLEIVNTWQAELLQERGYSCRSVRAFAEYLYESEQLITLKGKKLSNKRNFINGFPAEYNFREYREDDYQSIISLITDWQEKKEEEFEENGDDHNDIDKTLLSQDREIEVLNTVIKNLDKYNSFVDVLEVDNKVIGFCLGEILPTEVGVIHFQKADTSYRGSYQLIDNLFVKKRFSKIKYVNKQEDMGLVGLRKAKLSYRPIQLVERWKAVKN